MECLENLVGLRGLCEPKDSSCVYVNDLPMGSLKRFAQTANNEHVSGRKLFEKIRKQAAKNVANDFINNFPNLKFGSVLDSESDSKFDLEEVFSGTFSKTIEADKIDPYTAVEVPCIDIFSLIDQSISINVSVDGCTPSIINFDLVCGLNKLPINKKGQLIEINLTIDNVRPLYSGSCGGGCLSNCKCNNVYSSVSLNNSSTEIPFKCYINYICCDESIVCQYAEYLKDLVNYETLALLLFEGKFRDDKSKLLRESREESSSLYAHIKGGIDEMSGYKVANPIYQTELKRTLKRIKLKPSRCISCRGGSRYIEIV